MYVYTYIHIYTCVYIICVCMYMYVHIPKYIACSVCQISLSFTSIKETFLQQTKIITENQNRSKHRKQLTMWCPAGLIQCDYYTWSSDHRWREGRKTKGWEEGCLLCASCIIHISSLLKHPGEKVLTPLKKIGRAFWQEGRGMGTLFSFILLAFPQRL